MVRSEHAVVENSIQLILVCLCLLIARFFYKVMSKLHRLPVVL